MKKRSADFVMKSGNLRNKIISLSSGFWGIPLSKIADELAFDDQDILGSVSSLRFFQFIAAIESNFSVKVKDIHKIRTFGNLLQSIEE